MLPGIHTCFSLLESPIIPTMSSLSIHIFYSTKNRSNQKRTSLQVHTITSTHLKASMPMLSLVFCYLCSLPRPTPIYSSAFCTLKDVVQTFLLFPTSSVFPPMDYFHQHKHSVESPILKKKKILISHLPPAKATDAYFH